MASRDELLVAIQQNYIATAKAEESDSIVAPTKKDCTRMLSAVLKSVADLAMSDGSVRTDIGTFKRAENAERNARNPKTNEPVLVAARSKLAFKPTPAYVFIAGAEKAAPKAVKAKAAPKVATAKKTAVKKVAAK